MSRQLPAAASLEYLKKEAKEHLREGRSRWAGPRTLEIMTTHAGLPAKGATYHVSPDGATVVVSTIEQRLVFVRG